MKDIKFGFCVPIFANPGLLFFRTPAYRKLDWRSIKDTVIACERLGYDSVFVADHLFLGKDGDIWECLSTMSALAAITKKVEIIPIHLCNNFRHPGLVAKSLATISHISNGRISLFYDYGWRKKEFDDYGIDFGKSDEDRIERMAEGIAIIKGMLEQDKFSFSGKYYNISDAICSPKPVNKIPIWMGEANNGTIVKYIVKFADVFNSMPCSLDSFKEKVSKVSQECKAQGRDPSSIKLSLETQILICKTEKEIQQKLGEFGKLISGNNSYDNDILTQLKATNPMFTDYNSKDALCKEFMIGTVGQIRKQIDSFIEVGVEHFMLWFMDYPDTEGIKLFAKEILNGR